jgi:hypothetical protein
MSLNDKIVIAKISVSQWTASKTDKKVTENIAVNARAKTEMCRFVKTLIPKEALESIKQNTTKIRELYKENTLPWLDGGARVIPSAKLIEFSAAVDDLKQERELLVKNFIDNYDYYVEQARQDLGILFDESNYPKKDSLVKAFDVKFNVEPLPNGEDFRKHEMSDEDRAKFEKQLQERFKAGEEMAIKDLWKRLYTVVLKMNEKLKDQDAIFRDTLISNIKDVVAIIPDLNISNDENLNKMVSEVKDCLCACSPEEVRKDKVLRKNTADKAGELLNKMSEYFKSEKPLNFEAEIQELEAPEEELQIAA